MRVINWLTNFLGVCHNENVENVKSKILEQEAILELPSLSEYETRKNEIAESTEQIEGIFYLYNNKIIPDFYSECLISDTDNPCRKQMYHLEFYPNYMRRKFSGLSYSEKSIPRGRIFNAIIYIDKCYAQDIEIIKQIKELYRLSEKSLIVDNPQYRCPVCSAITKQPLIYDNQDLLSDFKEDTAGI